MMEEPTAEFTAAVDVVENACAEAVLAFARFVGKNWKMTEAEWRSNFADPPPTGSYWDGFNAAIDGMENAALYFVGRRP